MDDSIKVVNDIKMECQQRWSTGNFIEMNQVIPRGDYPDLPWIPWEEYMRAQFVDTVPGVLGRIIVDFPADSAEDNRPHIHPISDRIVTIIRGSGWFMATRNGTMGRYEMVPGHRVWMPRGTLHTFLAGPNGLLVEAQHNPWVPLENPECLVYPKVLDW